MTTQPLENRVMLVLLARLELAKRRGDRLAIATIETAIQNRTRSN